MKKVLFHEEARTKLIEGIDILANAVKSTLGPSGKHVIYRNSSFSKADLTKDGVTVAKAIQLDDTFQDMGASMVKEVALTTLQLAGDGTTTATLIAQALIHKGMEYLKSNKFPNSLSLENALRTVCTDLIKEIKKFSTPIQSLDEIYQVALIASNSDEEIARLIADGVNSVTAEGVITIEESETYNSYLEIKEGMSLPCTFTTPAFINDRAKMKCRLENARVLLCNGTLPHFHHLEHIFKEILKLNVPLLIMANKFQDDEFQRALLKARQNEGLQGAMIQTPGVPYEQRAIIEDLEFLTGAKAIDPSQEIYAKNMRMEDLGTIDNITISFKETIFKNNESIVNFTESDHYKKLQALRESLPTQEEKDFILTRQARLGLGIAVIHVGGKTQTELKERKDRVEDAVFATKAAIEEGICPGGGISFIRAFQKLELHSGEDAPLYVDESLMAAFEIFKMALEMPTRQIIRNCALENEDAIMKEIFESKNLGWGLNGRTGSCENLLESGIIDPTKVIQVALSIATSIMCLIMNTDVVIGEDKEARVFTSMPQYVNALQQLNE